MVEQPATRKPILVVEDDADVRAALLDVLSSEGYPVASARNGLEAIEYLRRGAASVIVLDLMMPVMSGYEFRRAQQSDPAIACIPVVVMTAGSSANTQALGVDDYFKKPLEINKLLGELKRLSA